MAVTPAIMATPRPFIICQIISPSTVHAVSKPTSTGKLGVQPELLNWRPPMKELSRPFIDGKYCLKQAPTHDHTQREGLMIQETMQEWTVTVDSLMYGIRE